MQKVRLHFRRCCYSAVAAVKAALACVFAPLPRAAELLPADEKGNIPQQTEDIVGPYALHDFFIYNFVRYGFSPEKIFLLAKRAFKDDFSEEVILKWLKSFYRRFFTQQFKRSCQPDGVRIGSVALGSKDFYRMASDASYSLWMEQVEKL